MSDELWERTLIHDAKENIDYDVSIRFIFDEYSEEKYDADFVEFVKYQTKHNLTGEHAETDLRFWNVQEFKNIAKLKDVSAIKTMADLEKIDGFRAISYQQFRLLITKLFSQSIFYLLRTQPELIPVKKFTMHIKLFRIPEREVYVYYWYNGGSDKDIFLKDIEASDPNNACFEVTGFWFLQTIAAPMTYLHRVDFTMISRYFMHELSHHTDFVLGKLTRNERQRQRLKNVFKRSSCYVLNYLYLTMHNLREEGLADFKEKNLSGESHSTFQASHTCSRTHDPSAVP
ncbi:MAG: hypothetical protein V1725_07165 [archaeon]